MSAAPPPISPAPPASSLLELDDLRVAFETDDGVVHAVDGVSLSLPAAGVLGVVGESGSGKSVALLSVLGLTRGPRTTIAGAIRFAGRDLLTADETQLRGLRGGEIAMVFQDPRASLHPLYKVGAQVVEAIRAHQSVTRTQARARVLELFDLVGLRDPARVADAYPHECSGGMCQRAMIAMALANEPRLLIADEPTTALDVTVQAQILALLARLRDELGMALVLVTHDIGVVAELADEVAVMYAGRVVERAPTATLLAAPEHPYTMGLLHALPRLDRPAGAPLVPIPGHPPSAIARPSGCPFHPRCRWAMDDCVTDEPPLESTPDDARHTVACLLEPPVRRRAWRDAQHEDAEA